MFGISSIFVFAMTTLSIGWSLPFILGPLIGIQFYIVSEQKVSKFLKKVRVFSSLKRNDEDDGWVFGWPFVGYIYSTKTTYEEEKKELYILTFRKFFQKKMKEIEMVNENDNDIHKSDIKLKNEREIINLYEREGGYSYFRYSKRTFNLDYLTPRDDQLKIVNDIINVYEKNKCCVSIIHGPKGVGKSMISLLLAKELTKRYKEITKDEENLINFCDTFKPTDPGDSFINLYNKSSPMKYTPLIVTLEEFDTIIQDIHHNKILPHDSFHILIRDKASWNQFFDRFDRKYFPNVIFVMTTNSTPSLINDLDPSYIREGRVDITCELK